MPSSETGTAANGISVARQFCRKMNTTRNTSTIASASVNITSRIDTSTKRVVSYTASCFRPVGKRSSSVFMVAFTALATSSALALGCRKTPIRVADLLFTRPMKP